MISGRFKACWARWLQRRIPAAGRVQLNQRQIFIMPSGVGVAFIAALALMLLAAINYQNSLAYGLTFLLGSVFVVAILHTYRNLAGLVLQAKGAAPVWVGERAEFGLRLHSSGRAHQALALGWPPAQLHRLDVPAKGVSECQLNRPATCRGWLHAGRIRVESRFPLGILVAWSWVDLQQAVLVYPQPIQGELPVCAGGADTQEPGVQSGTPGSEDFQGLRAYQPGDAKRRLHWKAYSRGQGLLVKEFADPLGHALCLDFAQLEGNQEARLSLLCYWVLQLSERQQAFTLILPGTHLAADSSADHTDACLRALALFGSTP